MPEMNEADKLHPSRIVYHRGSVIYARFAAGGPEDYRHPLDVPNGLACGCVCDECNEQLLACANESAKVAAGLYKKIPYFSHQSNTKCAPGGERGLVEAFRVVLDSHRSVCLPEARFSLGVDSPAEILFRNRASVEVTELHLLPKTTGAPYEILLKVNQGDVRLLVVTKRPSAEVFESIRQQPLPTLIAYMIPDHEGIILMRDVLYAVREAGSVGWAHLPEMEAYATEQRRLREEQLEKARLAEAEKQERIRVQEEEKQAILDKQRKERIREMDAAAAKSGLVKLLCAACKQETQSGPATGAWVRCPECRRATNFWPMSPVQV